MSARLSHSWNRLRPYFSFKPFDTSNADGRGRERQRRALGASAVALAAKLVAIVAQFITLPLTLEYLGPERFGMWATMSSIILMLSFADLGIGNGLLNAVADAFGKNDITALKRAISSAAFILMGIAAVLLCLFFLSRGVVEWHRLFNVKSATAVAEAGPAATVFVVCFALNIPATVVQRVQLGLQMGFVANLWQAFGSLCALIAIVLVVHLKGGLPLLVLAVAGAPLFAAMCNGVFFFFWTRADLRPSSQHISSGSAKNILNVGLLFFVLQIVSAITYYSDSIIIAQRLGAAEVAVYAIPDRMFSVIPILLSILLLPLWPAYGEALARGDSEWASKILKRSLYISLFFAITISALLLFFGNTLAALWLGRPVDMPIVLLLGFSVWKVIEAVGSAVSMYLNGAGVVRFQLIIAVITAASAITTKLYFVGTIGVAGPIWATACCYFLFALIPYALFFHWKLNLFKQEANA